MIVWINGALTAEEDARVSPLDHGLVVGDGVFETLTAHGGTPYAWRRHLDRLERSGSGLAIATPDRESLRAATEAVLEANGLRDARVRITVTSGPGPLASARGTGTPTTIVLVAPLEPVPPAIDVALVPWPKNERSALVGIKSTSYAENALALAWATERGAGEALFANLAGNLCEGTGTNLFLVEGDRVVTPPLSAGCLAGVTRSLVLELAAEAGIEALEEDRPADALSTATEAFLTSTTRDVQAISSADGRPLPSVRGPVTEKLASALQALFAQNPDP